MGSIEESWNFEDGIVEFKVEMEQQQCSNNTTIVPLLLRKRSDPSIVSSTGRFRVIMYQFFVDLVQVLFGTKLCVLFPAVPLAILAHSYQFSRAWIFALSLLGLAPLAERVCFLTEQVAYFTGPTVGGLLNATCGNATELIIALLALYQRKSHVLKYSLLGSILSNLLLVLGTSLLCGGIVHIKRDQKFDKRQADVNSMLLMVGLLCHVLPLTCKHGMEPGVYTDHSALLLSRGSSILMLIGYLIYIFFQLHTHRQIFQTQDQEDEDESEKSSCDDVAVIGFWCGTIWLIIITIFIALLSEYVVGTIEAASDSWGISVSFISLIVLPIVGNAAEHAGSVVFALKNKLDISLGVALGSATQISMFVVPLCVIVAWTMGIQMDLDFELLQTICLAFAIIITAFALQDGNSHYLKGVVLVLTYIVIGTCFFFHKIPSDRLEI